MNVLLEHVYKKWYLAVSPKVIKKMKVLSSRPRHPWTPENQPFLPALLIIQLSHAPQNAQTSGYTITGATLRASRTNTILHSANVLHTTNHFIVLNQHIVYPQTLVRDHTFLQLKHTRLPLHLFLSDHLGTG